ncbi:MAG: hypothetical protein IPM74_01590 [Crocinitomicaceae bacterium]|nr:hypothetical protein [Crocinitomicaceae bacterium]MBK8924610.1 hypothetical protein [Crocinitomicaceae bacterium]
MIRLKAIFFLVIFLFSLPGFTIELHYCKGKITDISFFGNAHCSCDSIESNKEEVQNEKSCKKHCHKSSSTKKSSLELKQKKCCKTEKYTISSLKLKANSSTRLALDLTAKLVPASFNDLANSTSFNAIIMFTSGDNSPPDNQHVPVWVRNRSIRI